MRLRCSSEKNLLSADLLSFSFIRCSSYCYLLNLRCSYRSCRRFSYMARVSSEAGGNSSSRPNSVTFTIEVFISAASSGKSPVTAMIILLCSCYSWLRDALSGFCCDMLLAELLDDIRLPFGLTNMAISAFNLPLTFILV